MKNLKQVTYTMLVVTVISSGATFHAQEVNVKNHMDSNIKTGVVDSVNNNQKAVPKIDAANISGAKTTINADMGVDVVIEVPGTHLENLDLTKLRIQVGADDLDPTSTIYFEPTSTIVNEDGTLLTAEYTVDQSTIMNDDFALLVVTDYDMGTMTSYPIFSGEEIANRKVNDAKTNETHIILNEENKMFIGAKDIFKPELTVPADARIVEGTSLDVTADAVATDTEDGDLTSAIEVSDNFKGDGTDAVGTYELTYTVTDSDGLAVSATRTITVTAKPTITQPGDTTITEGDTLDILAKVTANDTEDGDLTNKIEVSNPDNFIGDGTDAVGTYEITYTATDSEGNSVSETRTITVNALPVVPSEVTPETPSEVTSETPSEVISETPSEVAPETPSEVTSEEPEQMTIAKTGLNSHYETLVIGMATIVAALATKLILNKKMN